MNKKLNSKRMVLVSLMLIVVLTALFFGVTKAITKYTGYSISEDAENDFEDCLKEQNITLFINSEIPSQTLKENPLYEYLDSIIIVNCKMDSEICLQKGVNGPFPSWIINNKLINRDISLIELSENSGCSIAI